MVCFECEVEWPCAFARADAALSEYEEQIRAADAVERSDLATAVALLRAVVALKGAHQKSPGPDICVWCHANWPCPVEQARQFLDRIGDGT